MRIRAIALSVLVCVFTLGGASVSAQNAASPKPGETPPGPTNNNSLEAVAYQIDLLRKSVQTLNARLREVVDKQVTPDSKTASGTADTQRRINASLELLTRAEERAGILRKQLIEVMEKDTSYRSRLAQIDEEMRPENIERGMSAVGTTRTAEIREVRRRSLEIEKQGLQGLLSLNGQNRTRLDEDLKAADAIVARLRQRLMPLLEREIDKINPN
jgi:hypothetical protein